MSEKKVNYQQLQQLAEDVSGSDLTLLKNAFHDLEQSVANLSSSYDAQRATDLISQLKQLVNQVMSDIEPVCKEFGKTASEEADRWKTFATSSAQVSKA